MAKGPGGRPRFQIDFEQVERLAKIQCTQEEIAHCLGCSISVLERSAEFRRVYKRGLEGGKMSLRRMQWKSANEGNVTAQIWLGKQYLKQRDKHEIEASVYERKTLSEFFGHDKKDDESKDEKG